MSGDGILDTKDEDLLEVGVGVKTIREEASISDRLYFSSSRPADSPPLTMLSASPGFPADTSPFLLEKSRRRPSGVTDARARFRELDARSRGIFRPL
jgi:hypothetical protein